MFKKPFVLLMTGFILVLFITVYMNKTLKDHDVQASNGYNLNQLIRIDVEVLKKDGTYEEIKRITDEETGTIEKSREIFEQITWEPNGEAKLAGPEDVRLTLYFKNDKESTERLTKYLLFLTSSNDSATIISDHPKEGLGTLEKGAKNLSDLLLNK